MTRCFAVHADRNKCQTRQGKYASEAKHAVCLTKPCLVSNKRHINSAKFETADKLCLGHCYQVYRFAAANQEEQDNWIRVIQSMIDETGEPVETEETEEAEPAAEPADAEQIS